MTFSRNHFANEASCLHGAHDLARENVNFARGAFAYMEDSAVLLRIVLHDADCEPRADVSGVLRCRDAEATIRPHGRKSREGHRRKIGLVQYPGVGLWDLFAVVCCGPMI